MLWIDEGRLAGCVAEESSVEGAGVVEDRARLYI